MGKVVNINEFTDRRPYSRKSFEKGLSQFKNHSADVLPFQPSPTSSKYSLSGHKWLLSESARKEVENILINGIGNTPNLPPSG